MHIILGLLGLKVGELHGNLSQPQRLEALRKFKEAEIDILLATDLVARGLDIPKVNTVVNFTMPNTLSHYIHRVGRTARAGRSGRAVSLVGEKERKMLKDIVKRARRPLKSRIVPQGTRALYTLLEMWKVFPVFFFLRSDREISTAYCKAGEKYWRSFAIGKRRKRNENGRKHHVKSTQISWNFFVHVRDFFCNF